METKHINEIFEERVNQIFQAAQNEANGIFESTIERKVQDLDLYQKLKLLSEEHYRLNRIENESEYPFYIFYHSNNQYLLNQFASRAFLLNVDESEILHECIKVGRLKMLIYVKFDISLRDLPEYTFKDFINGKGNPILFDLEIYNHLNDFEYQKIRLWQEETLIKIVEHELNCLIRKIQSHLESMENPTAFLTNELEHFNSIPDCEINAICTWLSGFCFFDGIKFQRLDGNIILQGFEAFKADHFIYKYLVPENLNPVLTKYTKKAYPYVANEYSLFYTLYKVGQWLTDSIANNSWNIPFLENDWKKQFEEIQLESKFKIDKFKNEIDNFLDGKAAADEKVKEYLSHKYHDHRRRFDRFEPKKYFEFYSRYTGDILFRKFTAYAYFEPCPKKELGLISEAIVIQELAQFIHKKYVEVVKDRIVDYVDLNIFMNEIPNILSHMIYDRDLYMNLLLFHNNFNMEHWNYGLPIDMMELNYKDYLEDYFQKVIGRLENTLKSADQSKGILFLQTRLKQMKLRSLDFMKYRFSEQGHKVKSKYSELFKDYLEIETDFINQTKDISPTNITPKVKVKPETFESIFPNERGTQVLELLEELKLTVNGVCKISSRKKSALRGVTEALIESKVAPPLSLETIYMVIADRIGLEIQSKLDWSKLGDGYKKQALSILQGF